MTFSPFSTGPYTGNPSANKPKNESKNDPSIDSLNSSPEVKKEKSEKNSDDLAKIDEGESS